MNPRQGTLLLLAAVLLLQGCVSAKISEEGIRDAMRQAPRQPLETLPEAQFAGSEDYRVGPLDGLSVEVFDMPSLTREVKVSAAGEIALPLIGRLSVAGKTPAELEQLIVTRLKDGFLENPQVTVFVSEYQSQRVTVEGAFNSPGIYPLTGRTTLLQILATARGLNDLANPAACVVFREHEGKRYAAVFDIRDVRAGRMVDPVILGGDTVIVDFSSARANYRDFVMSLPVLGVFQQLTN